MPSRPPPWLFPISRTIASAVLRGTVRAAGSVVGVPAPVVATTQRVLNFIDPAAGRQRPGAHPFLSQEWLAAAREIRERYRERQTVDPPPVRVNYVVTDSPIPGGTILAHTDTTSGEVEFELEHIEGAEVTVTLPYEAAKALLVDADVSLAMQQLATGGIRVEGDLTKLLAMTAAPMDPLSLEVAEAVRAITQ